MKTLINQGSEVIENSKKDPRIADLWDRLGAFIVDLIFLVFTSSVLLAPFKRVLQESILKEQNGLIGFYLFLMFLGFGFLFVTYHTLSIYFYNQTLGKKIYQIRVDHIILGRKIEFYQSFQRALSEYISIVFLFIPFIEVFLNPIRRPFHERISDTYSHGLKKFGIAPARQEQKMIKIIYFIFAFNLVFSFVIQLSHMRSKMLSEVLTSPEELCEEVSQAKDKWKEEHETRLDVALALFGAKLIPKDCLEQEANRTLKFGEETDKAYLAKAFSYEDDLEKSKLYLDMVCMHGSKEDLKDKDKDKDKKGECLLKEMVSHWDGEKIKASNFIFKKISQKPTYLKVFATQYLSLIGDDRNVLRTLSSLWDVEPLSSFVGKNKALAFWNLKKTSIAKSLFSNVYFLQQNDQRVDFASEFCSLELSKSCEGRHLACEMLSKKTNKMMIEVQDYEDNLFLAYLKSGQCRVLEGQQQVLRIEPFLSQEIFNDSEIYFSALKAHRDGKTNVSIALLKSLLKKQTLASAFTDEIQAKLVELADPKELLFVAKRWIGEDLQKRSHQKLGEKLLDLSIEKRDWEMAKKISQKLRKNFYLTKEVASKVELAFSNTSQERIPASEENSK